MDHLCNTALAVLASGLVACTVSTVDNFQDPPPGPPSSCAKIAAIDGCGGGSISFSCVGDRPDDGDANLVCSVGMPADGGTMQFCCVPYAQYFSECAVDTAIPGCVASALGFVCSGDTAPDQADPALTCGAAVIAGREKTYCCTSGPPAPACAPDACARLAK